MKEKIATLSIFVNLILAIGKSIIGFLIGSSSILAEGVHSGMDVLSSGISLIGIKISTKPVDKKHPYGHYKFEVLSGLIITLLLFFAGIWMIYEAYLGFINPNFISMSYLALGIMLLSVVLNEIMSRLKLYYGKKENSLSLLSDGVHDKVDVYASIAVLIGIIIMPYCVYVDSVLALLIGLYIIKESFSLGKEATDSLLDVSAGDEAENEIRKILKKNNIEVSELKTQKKGSVITANIEIKLPKNLTVEKATKISKKIKKELIESIETLEYVVVQIKTHEITDISFNPKGIDSKITFSKPLGWERRGKFKGKTKDGIKYGPNGYCVCKKCNYKQKHRKGTPCNKLKCPKCGNALERKK